MTRPSRDYTLMEVAWAFSKRSTCSRLHVGAVFAREGRILATGYNGAPSGLPHCRHEVWVVSLPANRHLVEMPDWVKSYYELLDSINQERADYPQPGTHLYLNDNTVTASFNSSRGSEGCTVAEHAERNAIAFAARHGVALEGCDLYVTHMPCLPCSMAVVNAGVKRVIYDQEYRIRDGVDLLARAGVEVCSSTSSVIE